MTPQQVRQLAQITGVVVGIFAKKFIAHRMDNRGYKKAYESARARELYLAGMLDDNGIEPDEFDLIALNNL
jgi:hypothetical protein